MHRSPEEVVLAAVERLRNASVETVLVAMPVPDTAAVFSALSKLGTCFGCAIRATVLCVVQVVYTMEFASSPVYQRC